MNHEDYVTWAVSSRFRIGDIVYLKVDGDPNRGMVTGIMIRQSGLCYYVSWLATESCHFDCELTAEYVPNFDQPASAEKNGH